MSNPPGDDTDEGTVLMPGGFQRSSLRAGLRQASAFDQGVQSSPAEGFANALPVGTRISEFLITRVIGEGGFGVVYEARDTALERRVALKEYMPADLAERVSQMQVRRLSEDDEALFRKGLNSFINEAKILAHFDNPSLVKVYRFWEANGTAYMVMPFYEGFTLQEALRRLRQPPDEAWLLRLLDPLTLALRLIHEQQVFHRDIAPDNIILLADSGRPVLLDFGAARRVIRDAHQKAHTAIVKPGYAPVEQYSDIDMKQGPWSDIYALAAVLHYAIMGRKPPAAVARLAGDACVPLTTAAAGRYSPSLLGAIDRALAVRPENRTQSISQFRQELGLDAPRQGGATATWEAPAEPLRPLFSDQREVDHRVAGPKKAPDDAGSVRRIALLAGIGLALLCAGLGAWWWAGHTSGPELTAAVPLGATPSQPAQQEPPSPTPQVQSESAPAGTAEPAGGVAVSPPAALNVVNEFARIQAMSTPGYSVVVQWKSSPRFSIGKQDLLALNVAASQDGHVYVLAYTPDDVLFQYFPNTLSPGNLVRSRGVTSLPRMVRDPATGLIHDGIVLTEPPGKGYLLVIVSKFPRDFSHLGTRRESIYPLFPVGAEASALQRQSGSDAPIYLGRALCPPGPACTDEFGATVADFDILP